MQKSYNSRVMGSKFEGTDKVDQTLKIIPATLWDLSDVRKLETASFEKDAWPLIEMIGVLTFPGVERWKAVLDNQMIGFVAVDIRKSQNLAWIATIAVSPSHRRLGLGTQLMQKAEEVAQVERMRLSVRAGNWAALALYQKRGYVQIDVWPKYYTGKEDAVVMEKSLSTG